MSKLIYIGIFCAVGIFYLVTQKVKSQKAKKMLEGGDLNGALGAYKKMFISEFDTQIDSDGGGNVMHFLDSLKDEGTGYLDKISDILEQKGVVLDRSSYEQLVKDVESFSQESGVMNFKKAPVKEGKVRYAEFYKRLTNFSDTIPESV